MTRRGISIYKKVLLMGIVSLLFLGQKVTLVANTQFSPQYVQASVWVDSELLAPAMERDIWHVASRYSHDFLESMNAEERVQFFSILSLFDELRWVLSAMVYGFWFEYTPASVDYGIQEEFILQHLAFIDVGDPNMKLVSVAKTGSWLEITVQYQLNKTQQTRRSLQNNTGNHHARGIAYAQANFGFDSRQLALEESIKDAIYKKLRILYKSRPQLVTGELYLRNPTTIEMSGGRWLAKSDIAMMIKKVDF